MRLSRVMEGTEARLPEGFDPEVSLVTGDSRSARPGALFFALPGSRADGHAFAGEAARRGALAVVAARPVDCAPARLLLVDSPRRSMALAAHNLAGRPGEALRLLGVTGTNGKTTVAWLVEACAREAGVPAALFGTVTHRWPGREESASHTTPESTGLATMLGEARRAGAELAVMEVSSHALAQERTAALRFAAAGFTNLTRDHLDFHRDLASYFEAKRRLFTEGLAPQGLSVVNAGDPHGARLASELLAARGAAAVWRFGGAFGRELRAESTRFGLEGIEARMVTPAGSFALHSPLVGAHNVENLLCAAGLALAGGLPLSAVGRGLSGCRGAPGRMERVAGRGVNAFVDYAHTDDALHRALAALRALGPRRLIAVFGCGGDRDPGKRPLMGEVAARGADLAVATSDNPRTEDPLRILASVAEGLARGGAPELSLAAARSGQHGFLVEPDRRRAIALALELAREGDAVLIAGKGHERYQLVGGERHPFDDRAEVRRALGAP